MSNKKKTQNRAEAKVCSYLVHILYVYDGATCKPNTGKLCKAIIQQS